MRGMTKVPIIHIEEGAGLKLVCPYCGEIGSPRREFLSDWRDLRYESARCKGCGKEIMGIVIRMRGNKRGEGSDGE